MQRCITKITCLAHINALINESFSRDEITPSDNIVKSIIAVTATRVYIRKISVGKIRCIKQSCEYFFNLVIH